MKKIAAILLFCLPILAAAQDKSTVYLIAGPTINVNYQNEPSMTNSLGYFFGASTLKPLTKNTKAVASITFLNQKDEVYSINSINGGFHFQVCAIKKLSIRPGFQIAYNISASRSTTDGNVDIEGLGKGQMFATAGLGYELKRFDISATYLNAVSNNPFNYSVAISLGYKLRNN